MNCEMIWAKIPKKKSQVFVFKKYLNITCLMHDLVSREYQSLTDLQRLNLEHLHWMPRPKSHARR